MFNPLSRRGFIARCTQLVVAASVAARLQFDYGQAELVETTAKAIRTASEVWTIQDGRTFLNRIAQTYGGLTDAQLFDFERDDDDFNDNEFFSHNL